MWNECFSSTFMLCVSHHSPRFAMVLLLFTLSLLSSFCTHQLMFKYESVSSKKCARVRNAWNCASTAIFGNKWNQTQCVHKSLEQYSTNVTKSKIKSFRKRLTSISKQKEGIACKTETIFFLRITNKCIGRFKWKEYDTISVYKQNEID